MVKLSQEIIGFFQQQHFVIVSTIDNLGRVHNSCKGIVDISADGKVYLLDLYSLNTLKNLKANPNISITAVDGHIFKGYSLKGRGAILKRQQLLSSIIKQWDDIIAKRISARVIRNIKEEKTSVSHPEVFLPKPDYMILVTVEEVVDLKPGHIKKERV